MPVTGNRRSDLAVSSYADAHVHADDRDWLVLTWTSDEADALAVDIRALVSSELVREVEDGLPWIRDYKVKDPWGTAALGEAIASHLGSDLVQPDVTTGAGVGPMLRDLALLGAPAPVYVATDVYPDFPVWAARAARAAVPARSDARTTRSIDDHRRAIDRCGASVVFLERPALRGDVTDDLGVTLDLCQALSDRDVLVVVDESNANYCPPAFSAARETGAVDNLVVLRGLSKGYGLGGLRLGYCVSSASATAHVRSCIAPLQASSIALRIGRSVLTSGDVTAPLRERIRSHRPAAHAAAEEAGLGPVVLAGEHLPYLLFGDVPSSAIDALGRFGLRAKVHRCWGRDGAQMSEVVRASVPINEERLSRYIALLRQGGGASTIPIEDSEEPP